MSESNESVAHETSRLQFEGPRGPLFKALAEARKHFLPLVTEATAAVEGKDGKKGYTFDYAPLNVVMDALTPGLTAAGIALSQPFDGDTLYTIIAVGDSSMTIETPLPNWTRPQELGSLLTYLRRYQVKGVFGVADCEDDDGNAAQGNTAQITRKKAPSTPPRSPNLPDNLRAEVTQAAKELGLGQEEFHAAVKKQLGKEWGECRPDDALALITAFRGGKS
jgi:hypothetical protein